MKERESSKVTQRVRETEIDSQKMMRERLIERGVKETDRHRVRKRSMKRKNDETEKEKYKQKEYER